MTQEIKPKYRIGTVTSAAMVSVACAFWGIQVLCSLTGVGEIVSWIIGFTQDILFFIWFVFARINYFGKNAFTKMSLTFGLDIVELIPFVNDIPAMVIQVITLIIISRREDQQKAKDEAAQREKAMREAAIAQQQYIARAAFQAKQQTARAANDNGSTALRSAA